MSPSLRTDRREPEEPPPGLDGRRAATLRHALARWYAAEKRDLPWRRTRDPYAVWISESMLQQTRVETVIPYYLRFLERFPTIAALAAASEDEVVASWSGLGYYRRVRALHAAARRMVARHGGGFPEERAEILALPGVGPYTAGAVLSIAFGRPEPIVDGNVARVFCRIFELDEPLGSGALQRELWRLARALLPGPEDGVEPGDWNQALMELGALVCTSRAPRCEACPVRAECGAYRSGRVAELPRPAPRRETVPVHLEVMLVRRGDELLLVRRPARGRMARMWELPTREVAGPGGALHGLWPAELPCALSRGESLGSVSHAITHHRISARVHRGTLREDAVVESAPDASARWVGPVELERFPLTGLTRKILRRPLAAGQAS